MSALGTVHRAGDGRVALRFERRIRHPQAKVWRAITETGQLRAWFVQILDYDRFQLDLTPGAKIAFVDRQGTVIGEGEVIRVDPPKLLEYTWDSEILRWELEPDGDDGCRLVFTNIVDDPGAAPALGAGWHAGLDALEALLDGRPVEPSVGHELQATYQRAFA
ncbi:SRPBCC family protein [Microbispora sp. CA-102843]|uniref:SRPBCC family protein n=1 Tax=Microbispora sp. CA-102843 TaxID=3239952 RepID=UPI003D8CEA51